MVQPSAKLSVRELTAICDGLLDLGDQCFRYADQLQDADFRAFVPRWKFMDSFCATREEYDLHRRCVVEVAKHLVGRPWPPHDVHWTEEERARLYLSPLLTRLAAERDKENGVPLRELSSKYPAGERRWRHEFDPCVRRLWMAQIREPLIYNERWNTVLAEEARALEREVAQHATGISQAHAFDKDGRCALLAATTTPFGFYYDAGKSRKTFPVFSRSISNSWDITWGIEEPEFALSAPFEGRLTPRLEVRGRSSRGGVDNPKFGDSLHIRYANIVPGFYHAYRVFHTQDQLEIMIKAHLCLYGLMAPVIEGVLKAALES